MRVVEGGEKSFFFKMCVVSRGEVPDFAARDLARMEECEERAIDVEATLGVGHVLAPPLVATIVSRVPFPVTLPKYYRPNFLILDSQTPTTPKKGTKYQHNFSPMQEKNMRWLLLASVVSIVCRSFEGSRSHLSND